VGTFASNNDEGLNHALAWGGTFMMERPVQPKASETDPPAANQPTGDHEAASPSESEQPPGAVAGVEPAPQVVPGKPDGEVDSRA
jgi:hypothetical protein